MMRVLVLTNMWPRDDWPTYGIFVERQVRSLIDSGVDVDVMELRGDVSRWNYLSAAWRMLSMNFVRNDYALIHAHTAHCGLLACLQLRHPVVVTYHGYDLDGALGRGLQLRRRVEGVLFRRLSWSVAATIAQSPRGRKRLPRRGRKRNHVVPNGVPRQTFKPMANAEARERLGWRASRPTVLFTGDPTLPIKRFQLAEAAVDVARNVVPDLSLVVSDRGRPQDMPLLMNAADALLLTSLSEGSPSVVKEAMACDLPIVSVDVGDVRETTRGARNCHICPATPEALGIALEHVMSALPDRSDGRARTEDLADEAVAARLRGIFNAATDRGPGMFGFVRRRQTRSVPASERAYSDA
jgi:glycosyltransferase involved in cell wall biosynthesis